MSKRRTKRKKNKRTNGAIAPSVAPFAETGSLLRQWRLSSCDPQTDKPFTRQKVAGLIARSISTVVRWERGDVEPHVRDVRALEAAWPGLIVLLFPPAPSQSRTRARKRAG